MLRVGERDLLYWETCGNPEGKPAVVLHGGPGSGCTPWHRRFFDPRTYRIVCFDQRGCARSKPHASTTPADLSRNTTPDLVADIERLREHLGIERWLVWGGSWGATLALAYAEAHPEGVSELVLWGVTTGRRAEFDWLFRGGLAGHLPRQWERFRAAVSGPDVVDGYRRMLLDPEPAVHHEAAREWCLWEAATSGAAERYRDPAFALAFARIVTHYAHHDAWVRDGALLRDPGVPGVMVAGRDDLQAPPEWAGTLHEVWPGSKLVVVDGGHAPAADAMAAALVAATDQFRP